MKNFAIIALVLGLSLADAMELQNPIFQDSRYVPNRMDAAQAALMRSRNSNKRAQNTLSRMINDRGHHAVSQFRDPAGDAAQKQESDSDSGSSSDSDDDREDSKKADPRKIQQ